LFLALAVVLEYLTFFVPRLPQGGRLISLGMIPLIAFAILSGPRWGTLVGIGFGLIYYQLDPFFVHPVQFVLDYPLAFGSAGAAGLFGGRGAASPVPAIITANLLRFACHFISGIVFFKAALSGFPSPWIGSLAYNGSYVIPTTIACLVIIPRILKKFPREAGEDAE
jgi:thiamine transporter